MRQKVFSIVTLLLMAATGAWADDLNESFTTTSGTSSYTGTNVQITVDDEGDGDGFFLSESAYARIEALNGYIITKVEFTQGYYDITALRSAVGTTTYEGEVATVSGVNATSLAVNAPDELQIKAVKVYYTTASGSSESFTTTSGTSSYTGTNVQITVDDEGDGDGFFLSESAYARIEALNGYIITKVEFTQGYYDITALRSAVGITTYEGEVATVSGVNATSLAVNAPDELQIKAVKVYYTTKVDVTANSDGAATPSYWSTYYNATQSFTADANTTVYKAALNGTSSVTLTEVTDIAAGQAVILKSTTGTITLTPAATTSSDFTGNELKGGTTVTSGYDAYTLSRGNDGTGAVGFYLYNGASLDGSKAHLEITTSAGSRGFIGFGDDNTTGIELPALADDEAAEWYSLDGRRLSGKPARKGIYVKDGQKYIIR